MSSKVNANGEVLSISSPFISCCDHVVAQSDFDEYYIDYEIKQVVKKIGEGEDDFVISEKVITHRRKISEVVNAEKDMVGVDAYIKRLALSGESIPDVIVSEDIADFSKVPGSTAELCSLSSDSLAAFEKLPKELTKGMTYEQFMASDVNKLVSEYLASQSKPSIEGEAPKESEGE